MTYIKPRDTTRHYTKHYQHHNTISNIINKTALHQTFSKFYIKFIRNRCLQQHDVKPDYANNTYYIKRQQRHNITSNYANNTALYQTLFNETTLHESS